MATPSVNPRMNLPPLPVTPLPPPPSSSSPPPALTVAHDQSAAASEKHNQRPLLLPSSASGDTVTTVEEVEDREQRRPEEDGEQKIKEVNLNKEWHKKMQGWLVVLAILVASVTYSAGVNAPGGFWPDDSPANITNGHTAGNPVLADKSPFRYRIFYAFNATAFASSMAIIVLLLQRSYFHSELRLRLLWSFLHICLIGLVVAFCAASTRNLGEPLAIGFVFVFYLLSVSFSARLANWTLKKQSSTTRPMSSQGTNV